MTQLDRSVAPAIRQLEHFSILQPELHRMKNGMPLYVLSAGNEDVIRFDRLCLPTACCVRERCA